MDLPTEPPPVLVKMGSRVRVYPSFEEFLHSPDVGSTKQVVVRSHVPRGTPEVLYRGPNNLESILAALA